MKLRGIFWNLHRRSAILLAIVILDLGSAPAAAQATGSTGSATKTAGGGGTPGRCTGRFVNPVTDVCWSCLFPLSVGALKLFPGDRPDTDNPNLPICACGSPLPRLGVAMGFWEPVRLADVSVKPWCLPPPPDQR